MLPFSILRKGVVGSANQREHCIGLWYCCKNGESDLETALVSLTTVLSYILLPPAQSRISASDPRDPLWPGPTKYSSKDFE